MPKVVGEVTQQTGEFIVIGEDGRLRQLKAGDKIHEGDKAIAQGGENLLVTLINGEGISLGLGQSLVFDKSVVGDDLFAKEDVAIEELALDSVLQGDIDADAVQETAAGGGQSSGAYVSGATAIDRSGERADAQASTSEREETESHSNEHHNSLDPLSFVASLDSRQQDQNEPQVPQENNDEPTSEINFTGTDTSDAISGDSNDNIIIGAGGDDTLTGGDGNDTINGGTGDDLLFGDEGDDTLQGGDGDDYLSGGTGNDFLFGGDGDDVINGGSGDDYLDGGAGNDTIYGGNGDDIIRGGIGNDTIVGGSGNDTINGGEGSDTLILSGSRDDYIIVENENGSFTITDNRQDAPDGTDTVIDVENFQFNDQTLTAADLVDSNEAENQTADSALENATQALATANSENTQADTVAANTITAQMSMDLEDHLNLQQLENSAQIAVDASNAAVDSASQAVSLAISAVQAAQLALDTALAAAENTELETARLEASQNLLSDANEALEHAVSTQEQVTQMSQNIETLTIEPTLDLDTTLLSDNTPILEGRAEIGSSVTITIDSVAVATVLTDENGNWSYQSEPLSEGDHILLLSSSDEAGNEVLSDPVTLSIDAQANTPTLNISISEMDVISNEDHHHSIREHSHEHHNNTYEYTITIEASLSDHNETLSELTLTLPDNIELFDANGNPIHANANGSYSLNTEDEANTALTMRSDQLLSNDELLEIQGTITSTNTALIESTETAQVTLADDIPVAHTSDHNHTHHHADSFEHGELDFTHLPRLTDTHHEDHDSTHTSSHSDLNLRDLLSNEALIGESVFEESDPAQADNDTVTRECTHERNAHHEMHENETLKIDINIHIDDL